MNFLLNMSKYLLDAGDVAKDVVEILGTWVGPLFVSVGGVGAVYIIILAIQYIKAESDAKRAEAKTRIINCVIGVLTLLVLGSVCIGIGAAGWENIAKIFGYAAKDYQAAVALLGL